MAHRAELRLSRVLTNDPALGVLRHADAGYPAAIACAQAFGLELPIAPQARGHKGVPER
jgi:urocanate hydratase